MVVDDLLSPAQFERLKKAWPEREKLQTHPAFDQYLGPLVSEADLDKLDPEWRAIKTEILLPMIEAMGKRLRPWYDERCSGDVAEIRPNHMQIFESGAKFVEHQHHNHFTHNPEYVFTWLLYVDDNGYEGRGTTLYDTAQVDPTKFDDLLALAAQKVNPQNYKVARHVGFVPNRLLAFVDGPRAMHGSTPFLGKGRLQKLLNFAQKKPDGRRSIIQSHVAATGPYLKAKRRNSLLEGGPMIEALTADGAESSPLVRELIEIEQKVEATWQSLPATTTDARPLMVHPT